MPDSEVNSDVRCPASNFSTHKLESVIVAEGIDPTTKLLVHEYRVLCVRCGLSLEEVRDSKPKIVRRKKKNAPAEIPSDTTAPASTSQAPDLNKLD